MRSNTDDAMSAARSETTIRVRNLRKTYRGGSESVDALNGISFEAERGEAIGLLGPNGAGKTTLIKSLLALVLPSEGDVRVGGRDVYEDPQSVYGQVGAMLEGARNIYWRLTVRENMRFFARIGGERPRNKQDRHESLVRRFGLESKSQTVVRELSRGQKQKVSLLCTLVRDPDVLFLDEPTLGLDIESAVELRSELRRLVDEIGSTVFVSSHDMDVIHDVCDRVIVLNDGRIVADDTVTELLELFSTRGYDVTVRPRLDDEMESRIGDRFEIAATEHRDKETRLRLHASESSFYELVETLQRCDLSVANFETVSPDLEEVFLRLTGGSGSTDAIGSDG